MADESIPVMNDGVGFFASISDSLRAHIDERLKSPFAGAFVIAWLAVNWQSLLILSFSKTPIEARISYVVEHHSGWSVVVLPLILSVAIAITFYLCSAGFLTLLEIYTVLRGKIERRFDERTWVSPSEYMRLKEKNNEKFRRVESLALDNLTELNKEKERANDFAKRLLEATTALSEEKAQLASLLREKADFAEATSKAVQERAEAQFLVSRLASSHDQLRMSADITVGRVEEAKRAFVEAGLQAHLLAWNEFMRVEKSVHELDQAIKSAGQVQ